MYAFAIFLLKKGGDDGHEVEGGEEEEERGGGGEDSLFWEWLTVILVVDLHLLHQTISIRESTLKKILSVIFDVWLRFKGSLY